ncbi:MAG: MBL fold metallo-hydrolase [Deltaproteobacteria bacterium]|nr:MBL fold metallo-hydrolase [Deltaproteobacteria bacterium]
MTKVILAGTGVPTPNPERMGACVVVVVNDEPILFDCGRGVITQLVRAGVDPSKVEHVFLTHHHFDHTIGLPDLLLGSWIVGRNTPVQVFGPAGTSALVRSILEAFKIDIESRRASREGRQGSVSKLEVIAMEIEAGPVWESPNWKVCAVRVDHLPNSFGYRIDTEDRSIVFSGDTRPCAALVEIARGADLLIHEVFFSPEFELTGAPYGRHKEFVHPDWINRVRHTKPHEVGKIAAEAGVKKLVLTHLWSNEGVERLKKEVAAYFSGEIIVGYDLLSITL